MPRISTDNYDTVESWNGSDDLLVVEQPDGTKVATPEQLRQYISLADFLAGTLTAGQTSITLNSTHITSDSVLDFYTSIYGVNPTSVSVAAGRVTLGFRAQASDMVVGVKIVR